MVSNIHVCRINMAFEDIFKQKVPSSGLLKVISTDFQPWYLSLLKSKDSIFNFNIVHIDIMTHKDLRTRLGLRSRIRSRSVREEKTVWKPLPFRWDPWRCVRCLKENTRERNTGNYFLEWPAKKITKFTGCGVSKKNEVNWTNIVSWNEFMKHQRIKEFFIDCKVTLYFIWGSRHLCMR